MTHQKRRSSQPAKVAKGSVVNRRYRYVRRPRQAHYPRWAGVISLVTLVLATLYVIWQQLAPD